MCYSGVWGTVCSSLWGAADAAVVCRQLGYSSSGEGKQALENSLHVTISDVTARLNAAYGQGSGPVLLGNVRCTGLEYRLIECPNIGIERTGCSHSQDAGVICVAGMKVVCSTNTTEMTFFVFQAVLKEKFDLLEALTIMKVVWRSASVTCGGLCVTTCGMPLMLV